MSPPTHYDRLNTLRSFLILETSCDSTCDSTPLQASQERIGSFVPLAMRGLHALTELESRVVALRAAKDNGSPDGDTDDAQ